VNVATHTASPAPPLYSAAFVASLPVEDREALVLGMDEDDAALWDRDWDFWARPEQKPPLGDWFIWLILAGRGWGKTRSGAEFVIDRARKGYGPIALIGETAADVRDVMVEVGESSILQISPPDFRPHYEPSKRRLTWPNGVYATTYSGDSPDQLRGPQHATAWADEPAKWKYAQECWDNMEMGLRLGDDPRCVATTTPRPVSLIKALVEDDDVMVVTGSTYDNAANLSDRFRQRVIARYEGTRLGRQELHAELLTDNPGAMWAHDLIEATRTGGTHPALTRVVVGVDPSGGGDEIGIVVAGKGHDGHAYVLADRTLSGSPAAWARATVNAYDAHEADRVVAERNFGGDMVESTLHTVRSTLPVTMVTASRGKQVRAEPIAALYEQKKAHHVGTLAKLEDEMCQWDPDTCDWSPNRMDALVWALTELMLGPEEQDWTQADPVGGYNRNR
jgi:phage terminase large subunit-like protein